MNETGKFFGKVKDFFVKAGHGISGGTKKMWQGIKSMGKKKEPEEDSGVFVPDIPAQETPSVPPEDVDIPGLRWKEPAQDMTREETPAAYAAEEAPLPVPAEANMPAASDDDVKIYTPAVYNGAEPAVITRDANPAGPLMTFDEENAEPEEQPEEKEKTSGAFWGKVKNFFSRKKRSDEDGEKQGIFVVKEKRPNFIFSVIVTTVRMVLVAVLLLGVVAVGLVIGIAKAYVETTPTLDVSKIEERNETSFIYDSRGNLITTYQGIENRINATIDEIPDLMKKAFVSIEDTRFYTHNGVDFKRIVGSFIGNMQNDTTQGGSTITQQLIKLTLLTSEKSYKRKIQEAYLAMQLEEEYSKDQILEAYLNTIYMGGSNYGVKAAAKDYFGKSLDELTLREIATIAGMTQNPTLYNPRLNYYTRNLPERTNNRANTVLKRMFDNGYISEDMYNEAMANEMLTVQKQSAAAELYAMPMFVEYGIYDVITAILKERGMFDSSANRTLIEHELRTSGYSIYLTVDPDMQELVQQTASEWDAYPALADPNNAVMITTNPDGTLAETKEPQVGAVVIDNQTREIKALIGSRDTPTGAKEFNRAYQSTMPVGSSIKPLAVYGPALELGIAPSDTVLNAPVPINGWDTESGYPQNYGGGGFTGVITVRKALKSSINNAAARILMDNVTPSVSADYLEMMGVNSAHITEDGSGLALGTSGITPLEMAVAYTSIANGGVYQPCYAFSLVVDSSGNVILDANKLRSENERAVFSESTCFLLLDMMREAIESGTGTRAQIEGMTVAGKTGTNSNYRGVFFAGLTHYYTGTIWIGHDGYAAFEDNTQGGRAAAPLWQAYMSKIHEGLEDHPILDVTAEDLGLVKVETCAVSGMLATDACRNDKNYGTSYDWHTADNVPSGYCNLHENVKICKETNLPASQYCPEENDNLVNGSHIYVSSESFLNALSWDRLQAYFPGAWVQGRSADKQAICTKHTKEWYENEQKRLAKVEEAKNVISWAQEWLSSVGPYLPDSDKTAIRNAIDQLNTVISNPENSAEVIDPYIRKLRDIVVASKDHIQLPFLPIP